MIELIKKAMFTSLGFASLTKDKIEDVANEFVEQGAINEQEGKKLVQELFNQVEQSQKDMEVKVESYVNAVIGKIDIATKSDIDELSDKLRAIEKKVEEKA